MEEINSGYTWQRYQNSGIFIPNQGWLRKIQDKKQLKATQILRVLIHLKCDWEVQSLHFHLRSFGPLIFQTDDG